MPHTLLIADSGSTKTDWSLSGEIFHTDGINPVLQSFATIESVLRDQLLPQLGGRRIDAVQFYGSGQRPEKIPAMGHLLCELLDCQDVEVASDMVGAARALCGGSEGIAAILGTGANSCLWDGRQIAAATPALGFILGGEGSGASIGRVLINGLYKGWLPVAMREEFEQEYSLRLPDIISRVYSQPMPARYLASLSPFVARHIAVPEVERAVVGLFRQFISLNIAPYHRSDLPLKAVGSVAWHYRDQLAAAAALEGMRLGTVVQKPLPLLVRN